MNWSMQNPLKLTAIAALLVVYPSHAGLAQSAPAETPHAKTSIGWNAADWELEHSEFEPEAGWHFGKLANGMRYIIRPNDRPEKTALVRLYIATGSLDERDDERGFAHYVEHMAFNGSANVPEGEMVKLLEREGLAFGADTNASTGFDETQYKLDLPRADLDLLDTALMLMRETVGALTFDEQAVERERGVILSERRARNNYALKNTIANLQFLYPNARLADRLPIGTLETLEGATAQGLREFWTREYLPQDTVLVISGDFDADDVKGRIAQHFADWTRDGVSVEVDPGQVDPARANETDIYLDPALTESISITRHAPYIDRPDSLAERKAALLRGIGNRIVTRRLQRLTRSDDPPFRNVSVGTSDFFEAGRTAQLSVATDSGGWKRGLDAALDEYRRALEFGFSDAEVTEQLANIRTALENANANAATRQNGSFVRQAQQFVSGRSVPTSPQENLARFEDFAGAITPEAILNEMRAVAVSLDDPLIRFVGKDAPAGGEEALREAVDAALARTLAPLADIAASEFAYTNFGTPGEIVSDERKGTLDIRTIRFANGIMLNLKPTELTDDSISVNVELDGGSLLQTRENPLAVALASLLPSGGLGQHSRDELQTIMAGRSVGSRFAASSESFVSSARTTRRDLETQLQLMAAQITDPGYRAEGLGTWRKSLDDFYARLGKTPGSALSEAKLPALTDSDPRFVRQPIEAYRNLGYQQLASNIGNRLTDGAIELTLVGDFDEDEAIALVARTFGALSPREDSFRAYDDARREVRFTSERGLRIVPHSGEPDQAIIRMIWPTVDNDDWIEVSQLNLLARVMRLELLDKLREELGQAYSASANSSPSSTYNDFGLFEIGASIEASQIDVVRAAMVEIVEQMRTTPIDDDVLQRAREPILQSIDNRFKSNGSWMQIIRRAQSKPDDIARTLSARARYETATPQDLKNLAERFLDPSHAVEFNVIHDSLIDTAKPRSE